MNFKVGDEVYFSDEAKARSSAWGLMKSPDRNLGTVIAIAEGYAQVAEGMGCWIRLELLVPKVIYDSPLWKAMK